MSYIQLELMSDATQVEHLSEQLESLGALGVTWVDAQDNPIYEPAPHTHPLWEQVIITALFDPNADIEAIKNHLGIIPIRQTFIKDENWVEKNLIDFKPIEITPHFWICPNWHQLDIQDATIARLNPGLAFGTGEHPTTQMILKYLALNPPRNNTVVDYGCGSGILALSACLLGATHVYAVDIDPQALIATQNNLDLNHIPAEKITISLPESLLDIKADLLLANIFLTPLLTLHKQFATLIKSDGHILLSGVLSTQFEQIFTTYKDDFSLTVLDEQHDWLLLHGMPKKS